MLYTRVIQTIEAIQIKEHTEEQNKYIKFFIGAYEYDPYLIVKDYWIIKDSINGISFESDKSFKKNYIAHGTPVIYNNIKFEGDCV